MADRPTLAALLAAALAGDTTAAFSSCDLCEEMGRPAFVCPDCGGRRMSCGTANPFNVERVEKPWPDMRYCCLACGWQGSGDELLAERM